MSKDGWQSPVRFSDSVARNRHHDHAAEQHPALPNEPPAGLEQTELDSTSSANLSGSRSRKTGAAKFTLIVLALLLLATGGLELGRFVLDRASSDSYLDWAVAALSGLLVLSIAWLAFKELSGLLRLRRQERLRSRGGELMQSHAHTDARKYCERLARLAMDDAEVQAALVKFRAQLDDFHDDAETVRLFSRIYMRKLDKLCYRVVETNAKQAMIYAAISPFALLDTVLALWRNLRMIRMIATIYGGRPGAAASASLAKKVLRSIIYVGAGDLLADAAVDAVGGSVVSAISGQAAQGLAAGLFTARIGLRTMTLCRTLPFAEDELPSMKKLSLSLFKLLRTRNRPAGTPTVEPR